jgi:hypothetical protein
MRALSLQEDFTMPKTLQIKVTLAGTAPPVWRRLVVPALMTLRQAHTVLHDVMGWQENGSYRFQQDGREFGNQALHVDYVEDDSSYRLNHCLCLPGHSVEYVFGAWKHTIVLEAIAPGVAKPWRLLAGEGACPPARGLGYEPSAGRRVLH